MNWTPLNYGTTRLLFPQGFIIEVTWDKEGYKVGFDGKVWLKMRFKTLEEAKAQGIRLAKGRLQAALDYLGGS
jgi:hypothetical protein